VHKDALATTCGNRVVNVGYAVKGLPYVFSFLLARDH